MQQQVERIANRHVARCLTRIEDVFDLPDICADVIRKEIHFCAQDVSDSFKKYGEQDNDGNR